MCVFLGQFNNFSYFCSNGLLSNYAIIYVNTYVSATNKEMTKNIAIFASGNGSNAQRIVEYFANNESIKVACIIYNRKEAYVAERAKLLSVEAQYFNKKDFQDPQLVPQYLKDKGIDYIILAGFLLQVPDSIISLYNGKILNIHPSLLPKHGGAGMYGDAVHQAVIDNKETVSGITIHKVDNQLDTGEIVFQAQCEVLPDDTAHSLAERVHKLEYAHFPQVIERYILK